MKRPCGAVLLALALCAIGSAPAAQETFRMTADTVMVTVSVRDANGRTPALTAADFEVEDNGVRQTVEQAVTSDLPIDATVMLPGPWWWTDQRADLPAIVAEELTKLARESLRPRDRVRVLASGSGMVMVPWQSAAAPIVPDEADNRVQYGMAIVDALLLALSRPAEPERRHVIVLFEHRTLESGALDFRPLPALAARAESVLYAVMGKPAWVPSERDLLADFELNSGITLPTPDLQVALRDAARATGGDAFAPAGEALDVAGAFADMLRDFRGSYLLGFTPQGPRQPGWHKLTVKVKNGRGLTLRARAGYLQR